MIVYGSSLSPFVRKAAAFAIEKGVDLELKPMGIRDADPAFSAASPFGKMPALQDGDYRLADSSAICHYIEAKHPELLTADSPTLEPNYHPAQLPTGCESGERGVVELE